MELHNETLFTPMGDTCSVHFHHDPVPIVEHHVWPLGMGGPNKPANKIPVCPNGHMEIHNCIHHMCDDTLDDKARSALLRHYGTKVRHFAADGVLQWVNAGKPGKPE